MTRAESQRSATGWAAMAAVCGFLLLAGGAAAELLSALFPEGVPGYDTGSGVTVRSRARPAYDPLGVPLGGFMLWPRLGASSKQACTSTLAGGTVPAAVVNIGNIRGDWLAASSTAL